MSLFYSVLYIVFNSILVGKVLAADSRLIGGEKAPEEYGKFHASIQNLSGHHVCGGAVISKKHVVTAAHCVQGVKPEYMSILAGTNNLEVGGKRYNVSSIIIYDDYNATSKEHDIALLKTTRKFDLRYIKVLHLREQTLVEGDEVVLIGFGAQEPNGPSSNKMYALELPVFNQDICEYAMRYTRPVFKEMFCTFSRFGEGTCHGDSGSPLVIGEDLVGLVSWGIPCAVGFPDVHTRIAPYIEWLQIEIRQSFCIPRKFKNNK